MNIIDSDRASAQNTPIRNSLPLGLRLRLALVKADRLGVNDLACQFNFGAAAVDDILNGGLPMTALHELHAMEHNDLACATACALLLAMRARVGDCPVLWISESGETRQYGCLYPPGLAELGIDPNALLPVDVPDSVAALRCAVDGAHSTSMGAVILHLAGKCPTGLNLTATRRLSLAAQKSSVPVFLLRCNATPMASAAYSRWAVEGAPSASLTANAPGYPAFALTLIKHRGGVAEFNIILEWNRDLCAFQEQRRAATAPSSRLVSTISGIGTNSETIQRRA